MIDRASEGLRSFPEGVTPEDTEVWRRMAFDRGDRSAARVHVRNRALRAGDVIRVAPGFTCGMQTRQIVGRIQGFRREFLAFSDHDQEVARVVQADGSVVSVPLARRDDRAVRQFELYRPGREPKAFRPAPPEDPAT